MKKIRYYAIIIANKNRLYNNSLVLILSIIDLVGTI